MSLQNAGTLITSTQERMIRGVEAMSDIRLEDNSISIDARAVAAGLRIEPERVLPLIHDGKITSVCERGIDGDAGTYRLTFIHANRRARFIIADSGDIIRRSSIDFGNP